MAGRLFKALRKKDSLAANRRSASAELSVRMARIVAFLWKSSSSEELALNEVTFNCLDYSSFPDSFYVGWVKERYSNLEGSP